MTELFRWPTDFDDPRPVTDFDSALSDYFESLIASGSEVHAHPGWMLFSMSRESRTVSFIRRGKLRRGDRVCWEVRPVHDGESARLGSLFGIREYACVVISGIDDVRTIADRWLAGAPVEALIDGVTFWDKMDTSKPLVRVG